MNSFLINPAIAGAEGYTNFSLLAHEQWMGFGENIAPKTHAVSFQTRFMKNSWISSNRNVKTQYERKKRTGNVGMGGYVFHDKSGHYSKTGLQYAYSYHIYMKQGTQLSLGAAGTLFQVGIDKDELRPEIADDYVLENIRSQYIFDADIGIYYSSPDFYAGLSVMQLAESWVKYFNKASYSHHNKRHYQLMAGYYFYYYDKIIFEPSLLYKTTETWQMQLDMSMKIFHRKGYWAGVTYRTGDAFIVVGGVRVRSFFIGYAFDYDFGFLNTASYGTHEISIAIKLGDNTRRYKYWDRY